VLFLSLEIFAVVRSCLDKEEYGELYDHPDVKTLGTSALHTLNDFTALLHLDAPPRYAAATPEESSRWRARFEQTLASLRERGIKVEEGEESGWETYRHQRGEWESSLRRFALHLGYDWDEVTGDRDLRMASDEINEPAPIKPFSKDVA
jgi:hypothetical protein